MSKNICMKHKKKMPKTLAISFMRPLFFNYPVLNLVYVIKTRKVKKDVSVQQDNTKQFERFRHR